MCVGPWRMSHFPFSIFNFTFETGGYVSIANEGEARAVLFQVEDGVTNRIDASTRIRLDVTEDSFTRECVKTVYMSCPVLGRGTLRATWTQDEGNDLSDEASYQVIEPIRKLVTTERFNGMGPILNPSRLVYGTNAILKVSVNLSGNDSFSRTNAVFSRVSGAGHVASQWRTGNDWYALVEATSNTGELVVEARFNDDELQPRFVLPIVEKRTLRLKVFVVDPPDYLANEGWTKALIQTQVKEANQVFSQAGVEFSLNDDDVFLGLPSKFYFIPYAQAYVDNEGKKHRRLSSLMKEMFRTYTHEDCIRVFCIGKFVDISANGANLPMGVTICRDHGRLTLAHELGHVLGLTDCYYSRKKKGSRKETVFLSRYASPVDEGDFSEKNGDWGSEHGRGFYSREDIKKEILRTFLMYGVGDDSRGDISDGSVRSLRVVDVINSNSVYRAQVGVRYFKKTDEEVYANEK